MNSEFTPGGVRLDYAQRMGGFGKLWHRSGAGRAASFIGGAISRAAAAGLVTGACLIVAGMSPGQLIDYLWTYPPAWLLNGWTRLLLLILGLALISLSLRFNVWSQQQKAIDALAEDMSRAFHDLVNRPIPADKTERALFLSEFDRDYKNGATKLISA